MPGPYPLHFYHSLVAKQSLLNEAPPAYGTPPPGYGGPPPPPSGYGAPPPGYAVASPSLPGAKHEVFLLT